MGLLIYSDCFEAQLPWLQWLEPVPQQKCQIGLLLRRTLNLRGQCFPEANSNPPLQITYEVRHDGAACTLPPFPEVSGQNLVLFQEKLTD